MTRPTEELTSHYWNRLLKPYTGGDAKRSLLQLGTTSMLFAGTWLAALLASMVSWWLALIVAVPAAGLLVRLFIIQHDCGHGAYFRSPRINSLVGSTLGVFTLTPYHYWRRTHAVHHATSGDLDRRTFGEIVTLTVDEYLALSRWGRLKYRLYRNLFVLLVLGPAWQFLIKHRFPYDIPFRWRKEWFGVAWTNVAVVTLIALACWIFGWQRFLLVQAPITVLAGAIGVWLFYIQHQFEDTYWREHPDWDFHRAGIEGSSYYDLPRWLHWFTGNIGFHHVHHLASRIPNYRLRRCFEEVRELHQVTRLTFWESLRCARMKLWDEQAQRLIGFGRLRSARAASAA